MLCEYVIALVGAEESLLLYLNNVSLTTEKNTEYLEESIRRDVFFAIEIEVKIKQNTNLSFEIH